MGKRNRGYYPDADRDGKGSGRKYEFSQEDLDEYIHVCRPGVKLVVISLLAMLAALIIWGFTGTLPVTETVTGLVVDTSAYAKAYPDMADELPTDEDGRIMIYCFVDASRFNGQEIKEFGDDAVLKMPDQKTFHGSIESRIMAPVSMEEARKILFGNDWVLERCVKQNYNWWLTICPDEDLSQYAFTLSEVTLLTEEIKPIQFLLS